MHNLHTNLNSNDNSNIQTNQWKESIELSENRRQKTVGNSNKTKKKLSTKILDVTYVFL